jgi:hypothetical protein
MLKIVRSTTTQSNPQFTPFERNADESNTAWGERAVLDMQAGGPDAWTYVVLLGGSDTLAFRVRIAQSHLRHDMLPSFWSESILVRLAGATLADAEALHVPLHQPEGPAFAARVNGVVARPLTDFDDTTRFPNIAVIALPIAQDKVIGKVDSFRQSRATLDARQLRLAVDVHDRDRVRRRQFRSDAGTRIARVMSRSDLGRGELLA